MAGMQREKGQHLTLRVSLCGGAERSAQEHDRGDGCRCQSNVRKSWAQREKTQREPLQDLTDEVRLKQPDFLLLRTQDKNQLSSAIFHELQHSYKNKPNRDGGNILLLHPHSNCHFTKYCRHFMVFD